MIAREFSPGAPKPTAENQVRQEAIREMRDFVKVEADEALNDDLEKVKAHLAVEISEGLVEVVDDGERVIIIRIRERGSFSSGSADLSPGFEPVLAKLGTLLNEIKGEIVVAGHTDTVPIHTERYYSNWDLSSARATTVLRGIIEASSQPNERFRVMAHAATRPLADNETAEGRARNRRVEIFLLRGAKHDPAMGAAIGGRETSLLN